MDNETKKTLDKVVDWIKSNKETHGGSKSPWSLVVGLMTAAVALLATGFMYYRAWKQGKVIAKLKHEKDLAEQVKLTGEVARQVSKNKVQAAILRKKGKLAEEKIKELDTQLKELDDVRTKTTNDIKAINSWSDVDSFLSKRKNGES